MSEDAAEKEASEVLHSLLSVERIEKPEIIEDSSENEAAVTHSFPSTPTIIDVTDGETTVQYTPVSISNSLFSTIDSANHFTTTLDDQQVVIWEGSSIVDNLDSNISAIYTAQTEEETDQIDTTSEIAKALIEIKAKSSAKDDETPASAETGKKKVTKKTKKQVAGPSSASDGSKLEENPMQVKARFKRGCECQDESCFRGLNPEIVFKHRHNIAELTKGEHDMYLMGVTMACLANPDTTVRHRERRRLRAQYVYQGRRVCLDAFLYLENCTHYQLKRIRKHVMTHGVAPRVHGNHGKKPHNTFSLDIYCHARTFLKQFLQEHTGECDILNIKNTIQLPWNVTRKNLHDAYKEYRHILQPNVKLMGYSTFRHFMKEQFPHVKFSKMDYRVTNQQPVQLQQQNQPVQQQIQIIERPREQTIQQVQKCVINNEVQQVIPLVVAPSDSNGNQQTFLVTPVPQIISTTNIVNPQNTTSNNTNTTISYQLTNAGYVINEQGNIVTTVASAPQQQSFFEDSLPSCEEIEMQNNIKLEPLGINDVVDLLHFCNAIISGGKTKDGCPIITFPDNNNFHMLSDIQYQRLMLYLTSVPTLQEADMGFHLIIDRRKDRWNSVKAVLIKISEFFPGLIHVVYVLKPTSFLQKALSEVTNKFFREEFKFRMIVLSTTEELHEYICPNQLTNDLKGTLSYNHHEWIKQRIELEHFSAVTQEISNDLDKFTKMVDETEFPNSVDSTQELLNKHNGSYSKLKQGILSAAKMGESLLYEIKEKYPQSNDNIIVDTSGNVFAIERLLVQLEETEKTFDDFWQTHLSKMRHYLELRQFEMEFKELQINFDLSLKTMYDMAEVGETIDRIDALIKETISYEKICLNNIRRAEETIASGHLIAAVKNYFPVESVELKCTELIEMKDLLLKKIESRKEILGKYRELIVEIEKANDWCLTGKDLLVSRKVEHCSNSTESAETFINDLQKFRDSAKELKCDNIKNFEDNVGDKIRPETKMLITQALQRVEDIIMMCDQRIVCLNKLIMKNKSLAPIVPKQPSIGAPLPDRMNLKNANIISRMDSMHVTEIDINRESAENDDVNKIKTGHVLTELLETEKTYVSEMLSIIKGYIQETQHENHLLLPPGANEKFQIIFGNLEDIYQFHSEYFLKDLENCISSTDLVALCFVQKRDNFLKLYSFYCQNISKSEQLRESSNELNPFLLACQNKLGHKLPLGAYLLKPVQRITKYQLLLKDLLKYSENGKYCKKLEQALECMLVVVKCVNDSMHQISISGFPEDLADHGELLLQGSFSVWIENKRDLKLRLKALRRHLFLYQKALLFCKPISKTDRNKASYLFKHSLKMSQIGLTERVKGDDRRFEIWLEGRHEVHIIQAENLEQKHTWVNEIKKVLFNQLEEIKGEKIKQYAALTHRPLRQTTSWESQGNIPMISAGDGQQHRTMSCDAETPNNHTDENLECLEGGSYSSDGGSNSEDDENTAISRGKYIVLADYCAIGNSEINMKEGDIVELLKVGCAGWWYIKIIGSSLEGWAPASYLENLNRKSFKGSNRSQDKLNDH